LESKHESKKKEILDAKKELEFIENQLYSVGKRDDSKKIVEAAGSVVASLNAKYDAAKKELEIVKAALARVKNEYEMTKTELDLLKSKSELQVPKES
jgi:uncharacterized protein (DUF3084 family)